MRGLSSLGGTPLAQLGDCMCKRSGYEYPDDWTSFTGDANTGLSERTELVRAIANRCEIYLILQSVENTEHLIPTVLEDLFDDAQMVIDEYCIERQDD